MVQYTSDATPLRITVVNSRPGARWPPHHFSSLLHEFVASPVDGTERGHPAPVAGDMVTGLAWIGKHVTDPL